MKNYSILSFSLMFLVLAFSCGQKADEKAQQHRHDEQSRASEANTDCRYCGMPTTDFPKSRVKFTAKAEEFYCCSPRCMFLTVLSGDKVPKDIQSIELSDFYETQPLDAKTAFYVIKSDVPGPMGADLVPLKDQSSAEEFMKDHKGSKILRFDEVTLETIKEIMQK